MNNLIKIESYSINGEMIPAVSARELHAYLGNKSQFSHWIKDRIEQYGFLESIDFVTRENSLELESKGYTPLKKEYFITVDMAKELSMVERTDNGKIARKYFIECEKELKAKQVPALPNYQEALRQLADSLDKNAQLENKITEDAPKVEFAMAVRRMDGACKVGDFAKVIGIGRNLLFAKLRLDQILMVDNIPYQKYIDSGYFVVIEQIPYVDHSGKAHPAFTTMVTGKGQVWLERKYRIAA